MEEDLKIIKVEYLSNHWSVFLQILNLSFIILIISSRLMKGSDSRNQGTGTQPFRAECRFLGASSQNPSLIYYYIPIEKYTFWLGTLLGIFWILSHFPYFLHAFSKMDLKSEFFHFFQTICFWKAETKLEMNLLKFLGSEVIWGRERSSKVKFENGQNLDMW